MFKRNRSKQARIITIVLSAALMLSCAPSLVNAYASSETESTAAAGSLIFTESSGYEEGLYAEWKALAGAQGYRAFYSSDGSEYTAVDDELIRSYGSYIRVDAVGLKEGSYNLKVEALDSEGNTISTETVENLEVSSYDRSGFAFSEDSVFSDAPGAYNMDGTLKENAKVIYVTADTAKTVSTDVIKDKKGNTESYSGMQSIISKYEKGYDSTPIAFRIIGCITADDMDALNSSEEGLQIKGKEGTAMNITIEGIGEDGAIKDFGILMRATGNVELRNFGIYNCLDDAVSIDTKNYDAWIHDLDLFYGQAGSDSDQAKGDGTIDVKGNSQFITIAYNHLFDAGKSSLCGMKSESGPNYITYHHNWFDHSDSRHPRVRTMSVHVYNNYFDGNSKYGVGSTTGSDVFVENNYFRNCKFPMLTSLQGNDLFAGTSKSSNDNATFSKEAGGSIKAYNNTIVDSNNWTSYIPYGASEYLMKGKMTGYSSIDTSVHFDAYEVESRSESVPSDVVSVSGSNSYSNFDSDGSVDLGVDEANIDSPDESLIEKIKAKAGRVNGGDLNYSFDDSSEDTNSNVIAELKSAVVNYESSLVSVGGLDAGEHSIVEEPSSEEASTEETSTEEASTEEASTEEASTEEASTEEPTIEEPTEEEPTIEEPTEEEPTETPVEDDSKKDEEAEEEEEEVVNTVSAASVIAGCKIDISDKIPEAESFSIASKAQKKIASVTKRGIVKARKNKSGTVTVNGYRKVSGKKVLVGSYEVNITAPTVLQKKVSLKAGETLSANSVISCEGFEVDSWKSSNKNVAVVSSEGLVRATNSGNTRIVAIFNSGGKQIKVNFKLSVSK